MSNFTRYLPICLAVLSIALYAQAKESPPVNVIVVMADDLGIGDTTPTNPDCQIETPHLQKLAAEGLTFLDAHSSSSVCTPTRYGLLTGRYNWRSRLARGVLSGTSDHLIPADRPTLGHLMRGADYHTAMIGKWHLGWDWHKVDGQIDFSKPIKNGPNINGFDSYYAHCGSLDMAPYVWVDTGRATAIPNRVAGVSKQEDAYGWYRQGPISPDFEIDEVLPHLFDKAIAHVEQRVESDKPFFLYLALPAPHTPIVPVPPFKGASKINPYADFVMQLDHHMGQLMASLKAAGIDDQTLVIFTSDNGCSPEANFSELNKHGHDPSAGYRGHKADIYEGGHRVTFVARWPGRIEPGRTTKAMTCLTDIYPTLREVCGQEVKAMGGEDGFSLLSVFDGAETSGRDTLVSHSIGGSFAIRQGPWKLCLCAGSGGWSAPTEAQAAKQQLPPLQLFNLDDDPSESKNLMDQHPQQVNRLLDLLAKQVEAGRSTEGEPLKNDRAVEFLPKGVRLLLQSDVNSTKTMIYKRVDDAKNSELKLFVDKPANWLPNDKRPAIVFFFGGGWVGGSPAQFQQQSEYFASRGMVGIRVEYRVIPKGDNGPPTICCHDAKSAMRFVRSHAADLGIDPDRIAASGGSAGGHLAAFASMVDGIDDPADDVNVSPRGNAMVLFNPVFDNGPDGGWSHKRVTDRYLEFSPAHNISADDPPAIVFLGSNDALIGVPVVERFKANMEKVGVRCEHQIFEGAGHGFFNHDPYRRQTLEAADKFFVSLGWLKPAPKKPSAAAGVQAAE